MKKALLLLLGSLLLSGVAWAQADNFYTLENFSKGIKSHVSDYLVDDGAATVADNIRFNDEYGAISKRETRLQLSACRAAPVKSLYRYYISDDTKHIISTSSTYIDAIDSNGTCKPLYQTATDGYRWSFVTYKDKLIFMNGVDNAKKWDGKTATTAADGSRTAGDLVADLGAPFAELNTGVDLDPSAYYQYKIAFFDADTGIYTYSNARSNPIRTDSAIYNITLTDIPLGPAGVDKRIIYRTEGQPTRAAVVATNSFYKVAVIENNTTVTHDDAIYDSTILADPVPTWATASAGTEVTPPKAKFAQINQDRLFIANDPSGVESGKSTVYWSAVLNPDYFNFNVDYELIRPDDGDEITFLKNLLGTLTIGKTRTISKFYTTGSSSSWSISDPYSFIGCDAPWTAVNGVSGIIYVGKYGIYNFSGQTSELISDVVTDKVRDIRETSRGDAVGIYHDNSYYLAYNSKAGGNANNDQVLIFDITRNSYVADTIHVDSFTDLDSGDDAGILYSGSSEVDGSIYAHDSSFSRLVYRYKSQFDSGTASSTYVGGTEDSPTLTLGDNSTWADSGTATWADSGETTWLMDSKTGTWTSPLIQVNAATLDKLYWNESLGANGNVTWALSTGDTAGTMSAFSSEFTDPTGSDISGVAGKVYIRLRASLSTTSWSETPSVYLRDGFLVRLTYKKSGSVKEPTFLSSWQGGKTKLGTESPKRIKEIQVFYTGTSGTLTVDYTNESGETFSFDIDLSVNPNDSSTDSYFGTNEDKIFVYIPEFTSQPTGRIWQFKVSDSSTENWKVKRAVVRFEQLPYVTYQESL